MQSERFIVQNTHCAGCEQAIRQGLASMSGVREVRIDTARNSVEVCGQDLNRPALAVRPWELGYPEI